MSFNYKYFFKNILYDPVSSVKEFVEDYKKDKKYKNFFYKKNKLWIFGLPKSGTTLLEQVLDYLPYLRIDRSLYRKFPNKDKLNDKNISNYLDYFPSKKLSYIKTHLEYKSEVVNELIENNFSIIVSLRDIRDMMVSRYYHILNDKKHWQHEILIGENFERGFINSLKKKTKKFDIYNVKFQEPLIYYYNWILNWKKFESKYILKVWFEDFKLSPSSYIKSILNFTNFQEYDENKISGDIKDWNKKNLKIPLNEKLFRTNKNISTFRSGKINVWKEIFTEKINQEFLKILPGDLSKILK